MDFSLSDEQRMIRDAARDFAIRELLPGVNERDRHAIFPADQTKALASLGFFGMMVNPAYGGGGLDTISYVLALEEISKVDAAVAVILSVHNSLVCWGIETYGTEQQKEKYLIPLATGKIIGAFLLSEPEAGSDARFQRTEAIGEGDHYRLNGTKSWITSASSASVYLVMAQSDRQKGHHGINAFIVDKDTPGITLGPHEEKMGMRSSDTHSVMFTDVLVPRENRIGDDGFGFSFAMKCLDNGRIGIASQALGIASGAFERALRYSQERKTFGKPICQHQAIAFKLSDMAVKIEAARHLCLKAAWLKDRKQPYRMAGAMAKHYCADSAMEITTEAVQIFGGYGYVADYHVERLMREAKLTQIYEGTSEIQKVVISRSLLEEGQQG